MSSDLHAHTVNKMQWKKVLRKEGEAKREEKKGEEKEEKGKDNEWKGQGKEKLRRE